MKLSIKQYAKILYGICKEKNNLEKNTKEFAALLGENNDISKTAKIFGEFENYRKNKEGLITVSIESSDKIDLKEKDRIEELVAKKTGKKPEVREKINPDLIGGLKIQIEDLLIDSSVRTKLRNLEKIIS